MSLPKVTTAAILVAQKQALEVVEIALPETLDIGQVLVELAYSGICGSQLGEIDGVKGDDKWLPHLLGHEGSGKVLAIGPGVKHVSPGDSVVLHWRPSQGIEAAPAKYKWDSKIVNAGWVTTFNHHAVISENRLTRIDNSSDMKTAALYGCAVTTGFGVIDNRAHVKLGETVVIFGSGGIGLNIVQAAQLAGASKIVAIDRFDHRLLLSKACGATQIINSTKEDVWAILANIFKEKAPDIFIDNTGNPEIISKGYSFIGPEGRVILVGVPPKDAKAAIYTLPLHFGKTIIGTHGGECIPQRDIPRYMHLLKCRHIDLNPLISEVKGLSAINEMIMNMRNGTSAGRCLIEFSR